MLRRDSASPRSRLFEHKLLDFFELTAVTTAEGRYYTTPTGEAYPSVTTVLGKSLDKSGLDRWRARVGEEEANRVSTQAANRGTAIHTLAERYLMNEIDWKREAMPVNLFTFSQIRPILDLHVGVVYGIEVPLYSHSLRCAGRTDCVAEWDGTPTIIDFKTSKRPKTEEWIQSYFLQATTYAMMMEEVTGIVVPKYAIVVAVDGSEPQVFTGEIAKFKDRVLDIFVNCRVQV